MAIAIPTIASEGNVLDPTIEIVLIEIRKELDRIPEARLILADGSAAERDFVTSNGPFFEPGKPITIDLRVGDEPDVRVFEGLVVRHAVEASESGTQLHIELKDLALKLTRQRKSAVYREQSDDEVMRKLIEGAGLTVDKLDPTIGKHAELVQFYASDWDFLVARADINGRVVVVDNAVVSVRPMTEEEEPVVRLEWGLDTIHEFELEVDAGTQWAKLEGTAWDLQQQAPVTPVEAEAVEPSAGNLDPAKLAEALGGEIYTLTVPSTLTSDELQEWANARLARSRLALLRGHLVIDGRSDILPFNRVELAGVGERFNGKVLVSAVIHRLNEDAWQTELQFGLSPQWFARTPEIADAPAGGLLPPVTGLQIGVVDAFEADPTDEKRIKVRLPALPDDQGAVWARLARPDAGKQRGFTFWPEPGDEVVVGFLADDPRQAIVLGALHGSTNAPPDIAAAPSEKNPARAIVSRSGVMVAFDDEKAALTIATPKKNTIVIDDDAESISISDQHGNVITMDSKGIKLESGGDLAIDVKGKVEIKGKSFDLK